MSEDSLLSGKKRRFGTLKLLIKAIVKNNHQSDVCRTRIKYIIRRIVHK